MAMYPVTLVLLGLCCFAAGRPGALRSRRTQEPCVEAAQEVGDLLSLLQDAHPHLTGELLSEVSGHVIGWDLLQQQDRETIFCRLMEASTTSELKAGLDQLGIPQNMFQTMYDYLVTLFEWEVMPDIDTVRDALHDAGMLSLDREGVDWHQDITNLISGNHFESNPLSHVEVSRPGRNCRNVASAISDMLVSASETVDPYSTSPIVPSPNDNLAIISMWTGIDVTSSRDVRRAICAIVRGANDGGLIGAYEAVDGLGVFSNALGQVYPIMAQGAGQFLEHMEQNIAAYEDAANNVSDDNQYQYWQPPPEQQALMSQLYYLVSLLDAQGLFSLENDLLGVQF